VESYYGNSLLTSLSFKNKNDFLFLCLFYCLLLRINALVRFFIWFVELCHLLIEFLLCILSQPHCLLVMNFVASLLCVPSELHCLLAMHSL
jgi:hypothetical protein